MHHRQRICLQLSETIKQDHPNHFEDFYAEYEMKYLKKKDRETEAE